MKPVARRSLITIGIVIFVAIIFMWWIGRGDVADYTQDQVSGPRPVLDNPKPEMIPTVKIARAVGWDEGEAPVPAQGLSVNAFAQDLEHPRSMLVLPNGDVLVAETNRPDHESSGLRDWIANMLMSRAGAGEPSPNRISLLRDGDGDGVAEKKWALVEGLNSPFGMVYVDGRLYIANTDALISYPYEPGATSVSGKPEKHMELNARAPNLHWTRNLVLAPDKTHIYISIGSNSNIGENGMQAEFQRAAILEYNIDTREYRPWASGMRNPVGMDFNSASGELWAVVNERDMLGSDLVPDYLTSVPIASQFGWPWLYWRNNVDDRVEVGMPQYLQEYTRRPDYALGAHTAPLGLVFADDLKLGDAFATGAFVARHGSWNRNPLAGYDVVFIPFDKLGNPVARYEDAESIKAGAPVEVLSGFIGEKDRARGRPTMLAVGKDGSLLVSDDVGGAIWRVTQGS